MKVLLDSCVWSGVRQALLEAGHDVVWVGDWGGDPGDDEILYRAHQDGRVLITLDKDFGALVFLEGRLHAGILRLVNLSTQQQITVCVNVLSRYGSLLQRGAVITAELNRVRIRQPGGR